MTELGLNETKLLDGDRYSTGYLFTGLSSGGFTGFYIKNPENSGKKIIIDPAMTYCISGKLVKSKNISIEIITAEKMASPPNVGVALSCDVLPLGSS